MTRLEEAYNQSWSGRLGHKLESDSRLPLAMAVQLIPPGQKILDIGCGDGYLGSLIKGRCRELSGIDVSTVAVAAARTKGYDSVHQVDLNEGKVPYDQGYFDVVICLDVLEHLYNPEAILKEIHRVMRTGGLLIVSTANVRYLKYVLHLVFKGKFLSTSGDTFIYRGGHFHYFTNKDLGELLHRCGFRVRWRRGIIPSRRFKFLAPFSAAALVREWLSPSFMVKAVKD